MIIVLDGALDAQTIFLRHLYEQNKSMLAGKKRNVFIGSPDAQPLNHQTPPDHIVFVKDAHLFPNIHDVVGSAVKWGCNKTVYVSVEPDTEVARQLAPKAEMILHVRAPQKNHLRVV